MLIINQRISNFELYLQNLVKKLYSFHRIKFQLQIDITNFQKIYVSIAIKNYKNFLASLINSSA